MIVSHSREFVFLRPRKVAGTSVEAALAPHCAPDDIVTFVGRSQERWDQDAWESRGQDHEDFRRHATVAHVRSRIGEERWSRYFTFSTARNPWDLVVSQYEWATRKGRIGRSAWNTTRRFFREPERWRSNIATVLANAAQLAAGDRPISFRLFATRLLHYYGNNGDQYFDQRGRVALDYVIRFERLAEGFAEVCDRIGLSEVQLPSTKSKPGVGRPHYSTYYDDETRDAVARAYHRHIEAFGYTFEDAPSD